MARVRTVWRLSLFVAAALLCSTSAEARFLQTDPVGYKDDLDLYAYTHGDPVNHTDPTGNDAYVNVWDDGRVEINLPVHFTGDGATSTQVTRVTNDIQSGWTGQIGPYNVTTTVQAVVPGQPGAPPVVNNGVITTGPTEPASANGGHSYVHNGYDMHLSVADVNGQGVPTGNPGETSESAKGNHTSRHEAGHLMGLPDVAGDHGGIMDHGHGTKVTPSDVKGIIDSPNNIVKHCVANTGVCS